MITVMDTHSAARRPHAVVRAGGGLWVNWWDGAQWHRADEGFPAGNSLSDRVGVITMTGMSTAGQRLYVFVRSSDGFLWMDWRDGSWCHSAGQSTPGGQTVDRVGATNVLTPNPPIAGTLQAPSRIRPSALPTCPGCGHWR